VVDDEPVITDEFRRILSPETNRDDNEGELQELRARLFAESTPDCSVLVFDLIVCHQGDEAVERVRSAVEEDDPFAVAFLDVRMPPGPDGIWTAEEIRKIDPSIEIVIVTAYSDVDPLDAGQRIRPPQKLLYLQKPFHPHEIRQFASALASKWLAEKQLRNYTTKLARATERLTREIEEHKQARKTNELLTRAIMCTEDSVYVADMEDRIIFVNEAFCHTYGYSEEDIIGKTSSVLWATESETECAKGRYSGAGGWEIAFYHRQKDGKAFPVSLSKGDVVDEEGEKVAVVAVLRDITERMETERELRRQIAELNYQINAKTDPNSSSSKTLEGQLGTPNHIGLEPREGM
jgi:PAS domain S-box-containing protein